MAFSDDIITTIGANLTPLARGLRGAKALVADFVKENEKAMNRAAGNIYKSFSLVGIAGAATGFLRRLMVSAREAKEAFDELGDSAKSIFERQQIKDLTELDDQLKELDNTLTSVSAKSISGWARFWRRMGVALSGNVSDWAEAKKVSDMMDHMEESENLGKRRREAIKKNLTELNSFDKAAQFEKLSNQEKFLLLLDKEKKLRDELNKKVQLTDESSKKKLELAKELERVRYNMRQIAQAQIERTMSREDRGKLSLQELTESRFRFTGQLGIDQRTAHQVDALQNEAERLRLRGYTDASIKMQERADDLKNSMLNLKSTEKPGRQSQIERLLEELLVREERGLGMRPTNGR